MSRQTALDATEAQWIDDFIKRLDCAIEDIDRQKSVLSVGTVPAGCVSLRSKLGAVATMFSPCKRPFKSVRSQTKTVKSQVRGRLDRRHLERR